MGKFVGVKDVLKHNTPEFVYTFRKIREIVVYTRATNEYLRVTKDDVWRAAQRGKIFYTLTDKVYTVKRLVMCIQ